MDPTPGAIPIIDVDTHFTEPPDLWTARAPARLRERAPRVLRDAQGRDQWWVDRDLLLGPVGYCAIRADRSKLRGAVSLDRFEQVHPAASEARARLALMDEQGLAMQILYPNVLGFAGNLLMRIEDLELREFCIRAYNDGAAALQAQSGGRLYPQALLPFWDVQRSLAELQRCCDALGLTGFVLTDAPETWGLPALHDRRWDPLWAAAQERALPVGFHVGSGRLPDAWPGLEGPAAIAAVACQGFVGNVRWLVNLIFSGLLDRFPRLKLVSVESGLGWIPFVLELCEYQLDENGVTGLALRPRDYFRRQIFASYWFERDPASAITHLGEDNIMFETDFPHPTCLYPFIRERAQQSLAALDARVQRKVLCETAARVYGLELPGKE
jgi:predicted TIM-barrel fold metal-dependent hydrolase